MIDSSDFDLIVFRKPDFSRKGALIKFIKGLDTEAYDTGEPFLCCFEDGGEVDLKDFPACFFERPELVNQHYGVYNLKYDSGAILYYLPKEILKELWEIGFVSHEYKNVKYHIEYIPHKSLVVKKGFRNYIRVWDIAQYYKMSLEKASFRYLGKHKDDIETKSFSRTYVKKNIDKIRKYCRMDAVLVSELANYLKDKLAEFGIKTSALYSGASLSLRYYADRGSICTAYRFFKQKAELVKFAMDAYEGGKFEVTARGYYPLAYEYDITSAYPSEIMRLLDLTIARVEYGRKYRPDADYGFLKVIIDNTPGKYLPCGIKRKQLRIYPAGVYSLNCTKQEYDFITGELNIDVTIIAAYWLFCPVKVPIYKGRTEKIFALKSKYKNNDAMLYSVTKIMANSFYGKAVQLIENYKGEYVAGQGFNPLYGAIITANTRINVSRLQNLYGENCMAVHTDSVIMKCKLDEKYITGGIGGFEYVTEGECIIIACGQYSINDKSAYKGFVPERIKDGDEERIESWKEILRRNPENYKIKYPIRKTESWYEAMAKGEKHYDKINLFYDDTKIIDLNGDMKRNWPKLFKAKDFLCRNQESYPLIVIEK
jgi:hypothetical protein